MSALIGELHGPNHNSPDIVVDVWSSLGGVELSVHNAAFSDPSRLKGGARLRSLDPTAARNFAALLVRASEEVERMRKAREEKTDE